MAVPMQCNISQKEIVRDEATPLYTQKWYFTRKEIEFHTPSRSDGIDYKNEQRLRKLYCAFLQELGIELKVPQVTIATAVMFCHRFYMRQSHAKNNWQTVATVCMFLAGKAEETPRWLGELVVVAYKLIHKGDPAAPRRIREIYDKQKELVVVGETLLLATLAFDMNIELPYKSLVGALKRLDITNNEILKVAWNFVNDWLRTSLCLQHKPHYIAAGSLFFAAKVMKVKLPTAKGKAWWMEFDVSPKQLEDVIQQMMSLWEQTQSQTQTVAPKDQNVSESLKKTNVSCSILSGSKKTVASKNQNASESHKKTVASKDQKAGESLKKTIASCTTLSGSNIAQDLKTVASKDACEPSKFTSSSVKQHTVKVDANSREPPNCQASDTREPPNCQTSDTGEPPNCQTSDTGEPPNCQTSDTGSGVSAVEDSENGEPATVKSDLIASKDACEPSKFMSSSVKQHTVKVDANSREPPNCQMSDTREPPNCQTSDTGEPPNCQTSDTGEPPNCRTSDTGSGVSAVEDSENGEPATVKSDLISSCKIVSVRGIVGNSQLDVDRIREKLKKRSYNKAFKKTHVEEDMHGEIDSEAWIERELENGIVLEPSQPEKQRKI